MSIEIKDLVTNPGIEPFSRLKYLTRSSEEEVTKFFNGLFNLATLARGANDWTAVDGYFGRPKPEVRIPGEQFNRRER